MSKLALSIYSPKVVEQFLENSQKSITFIQADGTISFTNSNTEKFFGFKKEELIGKNLYAVLSEWVENYSLVEEAIKQERPKVDELLLTRKDKTKFIGQLRLMQIDNEQNQTAGTILIVTDLNKRIAFRKGLTQKINTLERLTKSRQIREGKLHEAIHEILEQSAKSMKVERVNAWLIDADFTSIESIGNYSSTAQSLQPNEKLYRKDLPEYFQLLQSEEIIVFNDTLHDQRSKELVDNYLAQNEIISMMDIPIRIEGNMVGVVCFEHTGKQLHQWDLVEQKFGLFVAQLISLSIETHNKQLAKQALEASLKEKETLLSEIHHRVKNNLAIISSLINLQASKTKDEFHSTLFNESKNMVHSIAEIHQLLYESKNFSRINFRDYLNKIIELIQKSASNKLKHIELIKDFESVYLDMTKAIPCGLIINELITNCYKHAFAANEKGEIRVELKQSENSTLLRVADNGKGMPSFEPNENSLGIVLVQDLAKQIDAKLIFNRDNGSSISLLIPAASESH